MLRPAPPLLLKLRRTPADIRYVRPRYLKETSAAMLVLSLAWLFQLNSTLTVNQVMLAFVAFVVRCAATWAYWQGRNWARILAIIYSPLCLIRLMQWKRVGFYTRELWMCEAALGIFLLFYLAQPEVRAWFGKKSSEPDAVPESIPLAADVSETEYSGGAPV